MAALRDCSLSLSFTEESAIVISGFEDLLKSTAAQLQGLDEELSKAAENERQRKVG